MQSGFGYLPSGQPPCRPLLWAITVYLAARKMGVIDAGSGFAGKWKSNHPTLTLKD